MKSFIWGVFAALFMVTSTSQANDIVINIPPAPSNFPKYEKCKINGKRRACYDKQGVRQLLLLWNSHQVLSALPALVQAQAALVKKQDKRIREGKAEVLSLREANKRNKAALKALTEKIKRDEKQRKSIAFRDVFIVTSIVILSVGSGIVIGYAISKL